MVPILVPAPTKENKKLSLWQLGEPSGNRIVPRVNEIVGVATAFQKDGALTQEAEVLEHGKEVRVLCWEVPWGYCSSPSRHSCP